MLLIKNGTVHVGNGEVRKNCDLLVKSGKIVKLGENIHGDAKIINAAGMHVFPGFVDPCSGIGSQDCSFSVKDADEFSAFNPAEVMFEELYKMGITTIASATEEGDVTGGKMAAFKTYGDNMDEMLVKSFVGLKGSISHNVIEAYGDRNILKTKMGIFSLLQGVFKNSGDGVEREIIEKVLNREVPLFVTAGTKAEIDALIYSVKDYGIRLVICGAYEAEYCIDSIRGVNASVIIGEQIYLSQNVYKRMDLSKLNEILTGRNAVSLTMAGMHGSAGKVKYLWNAMRIHNAGIDSEEVVRMMTSYPAQILGVDDVLGTLEVEKDADIVIYSNDPIKHCDAVNMYTVIKGEIVYRGGGCELCR